MIWLAGGPVVELGKFAMTGYQRKDTPKMKIIIIAIQKLGTKPEDAPRYRTAERNALPPFFEPNLGRNRVTAIEINSVGIIKSRVNGTAPSTRLVASSGKYSYENPKNGGHVANVFPRKQPYCT